MQEGDRCIARVEWLPEYGERHPNGNLNVRVPLTWENCTFLRTSPGLTFSGIKLDKDGQMLTVDNNRIYHPR